jgi:tRNA threonylcarbamoyladenosine biosynthesis protein TsaB
LLLALDTATRVLSLALHDGERVRYEATWYTANNHTVELTPAIESALAHCKLAPQALRAVAVALGPGSFTGLRIGLSVAKGLALAWELPLVGVPTLEITAAGVPHFDSALIAVLQAGRTRICAQPFIWERGTWRATASAVITSWERLLADVRVPTLVAGEVDEAGRAQIATVPNVQIASGAVSLRRAGFLAERAWERLREGRTDDPRTLAPIYLHQPGVPHP